MAAGRTREGQDTPGTHHCHDVFPLRRRCRHLPLSDFDFFRGVHLDKSIPALYDDGEIGNEPIKKKKAFSDVGDTETILKERWTAAKFVMHQLRVILDNQYDPSAEPEDTLVDNIPRATFMKMVRPAIWFIAEADAMAILKRAVFIVFSKSHIYYRTPSAQPVP